MNELALFAGAGGGLLASEWLLGWRTVCAVEKEPYRREVLLRRQRDGLLGLFPIWDDVTTFDGRSWRGIVDVVSAGFPCQPFSSAARGRLVATNMWSEVVRIANEIQPRCVFVENVYNSHLPGLVLRASDLGAPHVRRRLWSVGYADSDGESDLPLDDEVARLSETREAVWSYVAPEDLRVADGMAHRMDRLSAIGDGQVPIVAACAWERLKGEG